ncbi:hypothetical protein Clim_1919 [Chlorobium limicola DSM 245]|uniref:Uncharacterized protein n=1 Tax=Chlorobium limicola (strain DSM 245 / NBRC 103803 / 6330) TaxID=290315 RepID=B3EFI9_CHLL2|nr:hypothetical protein [Chlorobium limicola]ACD90951.1 hypothetical protein Clim_1919 [Chlorobium limicola DSM 245]
MKNRRIAILTISIIVVIAVLFRFVYPEVPITKLMTVIPLTALAAAFGIDVFIQHLQKKREASDENRKKT